MSEGSYQIEPQRGLAGLSLGSTRSDVRAFFGDGWRLFCRTPDDNESDYWPHIPVFAYYDDDQNLDALEFATSAEILFQGKDLMGAEPRQAAELLMQADPRAAASCDGVRSNELGIGIWADGFDDGTPVQSVLVSRKGYWS